MPSVVLGHDRQVQGGAEVAGPERAAQFGEGVEDLPVGRVLGQVRGRRGFRCWRFVILAGEGDQGLAGDLQVADLLLKLAEPGGGLVDRGLGLLRLTGEGLLAGVDPVQQVPAGVRRGHVTRHDRAGAPAIRRAITSVIAQ